MRGRIVTGALVGVLIALAMLACGVPRAAPTPYFDGYRVAAYDSRTRQWTIIHSSTWSGEYRVMRLTLACDFTVTGRGEKSTGRDACGLQVGRLMTENAFSGGKGASLVVITEMGPDWIAIEEGEGPDRLSQHFTILKNELLSPRADGDKQ